MRPALQARLAALAHVAPEGAAISLALLVVGAIGLMVGFGLSGVAIVLFALAVASFFRDPERFADRTDGVVISGADGKVTDVSEVALPGASGARFNRISVFMSPLNVHVNRAPVSGIVLKVEHTPGTFAAAFRDDASEHNERNLIVFMDPAGRRHGMMQVAGYLARRIVCRLRVRDRIQLGQRVGLIMFGSRVDHFIPA
ncbi:MAG TPA: phosphatidylserine decarboxylase, partial [Candidatus Binataceae bacterium]